MPTIGITDSISESALINSIILSENKYKENNIYPKEGTQAQLDLIRGNWTVSYTSNGIKNTDKLVIDSFYIDPTSGIPFERGNLYTGNSDNAKVLICTYDPINFVGVDSDYGCVSTNSLGTYYEYYTFRLSGNEIISGFYGSGLGRALAIYDLVTRGKPLTGYRGQGVYASNYYIIQWNKYQDDNFYCIDIVDEKDNVYPGLRAVKCGEQIVNFSPKDYVDKVLKIPLTPGFTFYWKVWSKSNSHDFEFHGDGYRGKVIVL